MGKEGKEGPLHNMQGRRIDTEAIALFKTRSMGLTKVNRVGKCNLTSEMLRR